MQIQNKRCTKSESPRQRGASATTKGHRLLELPSPSPEAMSISLLEMNRRLRAEDMCELLGEKKSSLYGRMNPNAANFDPTFPLPIPMSPTGKGPKRWKAGAVIAWLNACEAAANTH